jgi:hypothetical protein
MTSARFFHAFALFAVALLAVLATASRASAVAFYVYPATFKLVLQSIPDPYGGVILTRKIGNKELINLALGRSLTTPIEKNFVLAGAGTYADHADETTLIVFDTSENGINQIKATVATISSLDFERAILAKKSQGSGFGTATFAATTLGNPAQNGLVQSTIQGTGGGAGNHDPFGGSAKVSGKGNVSGRLTFVFTDGAGTQTFDGIIVKGQAKVSGKPIGSFIR